MKNFDNQGFVHSFLFNRSMYEKNWKLKASAKDVIRFFDYLKRFQKMYNFLGNNEVKAFLRLLLQLQKDYNPIILEGATKNQGRHLEI